MLHYSSRRFAIGFLYGICYSGLNHGGLFCRNIVIFVACACSRLCRPISFMSGVFAINNVRRVGTSLRKTLATSLAFIAGFSLVFVSLGATATTLGKFLLAQFTLMSKIAGMIIILGPYIFGCIQKL